MMQTKLPQQALAQIWGLADMDMDGRLGCDEFVLAMYLCDTAMQGEKIPKTLPLELIPPSFRVGVGSRHGSVASASGGGGVVSGISSRHGSVSSQGGSGISSSAVAPVDADLMSGLPGQSELSAYISDV